MRNEPDIAVAIRTFGNSKSQEGLRVKAGTRFAIGNPQGGLKVITKARFQALKQMGLMRALNDDDAKAAPAARPVDEATAAQIAANKAARAAKPTTTESIKRPSLRAAARRRTQEAEPAAPRPLNARAQESAQNGSQNGNHAPASSSAEAPASNSSTSRLRGTRRG